MKYKKGITYILLVCALITLMIVPKKTICYIGYTTDYKQTDLFATISLDGDIIYNDAVPSTHMHIIKKEVNLKLGIHTLTISLPNEKTKQTMRFFYLFQRYIVIDFYPLENRIQNEILFRVDLNYRFAIE